MINTKQFWWIFPILTIFLFACQKSEIITSTNTTTKTDTTTVITGPKVGGTLTVSTLTSSAGGNYAPRNVMAIWIETNTGTYVKTLLAYCYARSTYLSNWRAKSSYNIVDAVTSATQSNHATRTCSWNGTNTARAAMPDGVYRVCMELTDRNGTGNLSTFTFTKGASPVTLTPANQPSFSNILIKWQPK